MTTPVAPPRSTDVLSAIVAGARRSAQQREHVTPRAALEAAASARRARGDAFARSLRAPGIRVIAECKRRSPSRGVLRQDYDPAAIARAYARAGAAAISVLTEPSFFDGALDHLRAARTTVDVPLLRKDFIVSEYQVVEAVANGADAVLFIVAALTPGELHALIRFAATCGLAALVEVHDRNELAIASDAGASIVGVNSRNLKTLQVHPSLLGDLGSRLPPHVTAVAESGLRTAEDLTRLHAAGYHAFLIGERFMADADPGAALGNLLDAVGAAGR